MKSDLSIIIPNSCENLVNDQGVVTDEIAVLGLEEERIQSDWHVKKVSQTHLEITIPRNALHQR